MAFFEFVEQGCFTELLDLFNFLKSLKLKQHLGKEAAEEKDQPKVKLIAIDCIQSICYQARSVVSAFINCSPSLLTFNKPTLTDLLQKDGVYESVQDFFVNFIFQMVSSLTSREKKSRKEEHKTHGSNLMASSLIDMMDQEPSEANQDDAKSDGADQPK